LLALAGSHRELHGVCAAWVSLNTDDVASLNVFEHCEIALEVGLGGKDLHLCRVAFQIDKEQLGALRTDVVDTASDRHFLVLQKHAFLSADLLELGPEFVEAHAAVELVWVGVLTVVALCLEPVPAVVGVLGGVELLFLLLLLLGLVFLFFSLFSLLLSFLSIGFTLLLALLELVLADLFAGDLVEEGLDLLVGLSRGLHVLLFFVGIHLHFTE